MDILADILRNLALRGTVYFQANFRAPWGMQLRNDQVANFHIIVTGHCWVSTTEEHAFKLSSGDIVVFPHGTPHTLVSSRETTPLPAKEVLAGGRKNQKGTQEFGGNGNDVCTLICGHFTLKEPQVHSLFTQLPDIVLVEQNKQYKNANWIQAATKLAMEESHANYQGSSVVVDRLAEVLLIQVLRAFQEQCKTKTGFLDALAEPALMRVLTLIHTRPAHPWTLIDFSRESGMSRSSFAARFKEQIGLSPMRYLTDWRMQRAYSRLISTSINVSTIAEEVGYDSEFSFSKAFKRVFGLAPGTLKRTARNNT